MSGRRKKTSSLVFGWIKERLPGELNPDDLGILGAEFGCFDDIQRQNENEKRLKRWRVAVARAKKKNKKAPKRPALIPVPKEVEDSRYEAVIEILGCRSIPDKDDIVYEVSLQAVFADGNFDLRFSFEVAYHRITEESTDDDCEIPIVIEDYGSRNNAVIKRRQYLISNIGSHIAKVINDRIGELTG